MKIKSKKKLKKGQATLQSFEMAKEMKKMGKNWTEKAIRDLPKQIALKKEQLERSNLPLHELEHYEGRLVGQLKELLRTGRNDLVIKMVGELGVVRAFIKRKRDEDRRRKGL